MAKKTYIANDLLREARDLEKLTQQDLAEKIGTTALNVGRWEGGKVFPSPYFRRKLCEFFNKSDEELGLLRDRYRSFSEEVDLSQSQPDLEHKETEIVSPPLPRQVVPTVSDRGNPVHQNFGSPNKGTRVTFKAAIIMGTITVVLVAALITGIFLYLSNHLASPKLTSSATPATTATLIDPCAADPILTEPVDGRTLSSRTVIFTWEAPRDCLPEGYTVRITANYDPEAKPWIVDTGWAPTFYKYTFSTDGTYYWHIRACKPCTPFHPGHWAIRSFTIHISSTP